MIVWLIDYCYGKVGCGFHVSKPWHRAEDPDFQQDGGGVEGEEGGDEGVVTEGLRN